MITRKTASRFFALPAFFFALIVVGCQTNDNALGSRGIDAGKSDDVRTITCQQNGKIYQVGETVTLSACTSCVCQKDSTLGLCTGACAPDAGQKDVATEDTPGTVNACTQAGGSCVAVYPGTCASGVVNSSLSCGPGVGSECCLPGGAGGSSGAGSSSGTGGKNGAGGSNGTGGNTSVFVNTCTQAGGSCVAVYPGACASGILNYSLSCLPPGMVGSECCMPGGIDAGTDGGNQTLTELCKATGGQVTSGLCCASNSGFPEMCQGVGACSCGPTSSKTISVCDCGTGCFSQTLGCVAK